jgi:hypothetical protein
MVKYANFAKLCLVILLLSASYFPVHAYAWDYVSTVVNVTPYNGKVYVGMAAGGISGAGDNPCGGFTFIIDPATPAGSDDGSCTGREVIRPTSIRVGR